MVKLIKKSGQPEMECLPNVLRIAVLAADKKAAEIKAYDVRGLTVLADSFVMCSSSSQPQFRAIYNAVKDGMKEIGVAPRKVAEGGPAADWLVLDYGVIIFHLFRNEAREFYDLDGLWADAPLLDLDLDD